MAKLIFLVAHPIEDASRRYRVQQFIPLLERAGHECTVSEFSTPQLFHALRSKGRYLTKVFHTFYCSLRRFARLVDLSDFDLVVIHREVFPFLAPMLENWVLNHHSKVVFSLDDATYAVHPDNVHMSHPMLYRLKYGRCLDQVIARSAHVIVGNRTLAKYARQFNTEVSIIPTVVDCNKYEYRSPAKPDGLPLTIGWIGSRSTGAYLLNIVRPLRQLAERFGDRVNFRFFGCEDLELDLPNLVVRPFRLEAELDDLRSLDIGLMPMPDTVWTRGKCAFKAVQYMAMGIPTIASPVGATLDLIQHNHNGLLARSEEDWYRSLESLITDCSARQRISMAGRDTILKSYSLQVWGPKLLSLIDQLLQPCFSGADLPAVAG